jgi:predicted DNA-binding protein
MHMEKLDDDQVGTLAVRMTNRQRRQLDIIAQLNGRTTTEEIRLLLEGHIEQARTNPDLAAKADQARAEVERETQARLGAIASLFTEPDGGGSSSASATPTRQGKPGAAG